jgi:hypothetical protein
MFNFEKYNTKNGPRMVASSESLKQLYDWMIALDTNTLDTFDSLRDNGKSKTSIVIKLSGSNIAKTLLHETNMTSYFSNYKGNKKIKMAILYSMNDLWEFLAYGHP